MKASQLIAAAVGVLGVAAIANAAVVLSFNGDYVTTDRSFASGTSTVGDFDGDTFSDDARSRLAYGPLTVAATYTGPTFSGGFEIEFFNTTSIVNNANGVRQQAPNDALQIARSVAASTSGRGAAVITYPISGTPELGSGSTFELRTRNVAAVATVGRFVVGQGGNLYVSQDTFSGPISSIDTKMLTLAGSTAFALYTPGTALNFDQGNAVFAPIVFNAVSSVGFYLESDAFTGTRFDTSIDRFVVDAQPIPEPTGAFALASLFGAAMLRRRSR